MGPEVAPAACFEGGDHQVQGPPLLERGKLEYPPEKAELTVSDGIRRSQGDGEGAERGRMSPGPLPRENRPPVLEHGPCRHLLAVLLNAGMALDDVVQVECAAGCGHLLHSDRGSFECPCHLPLTKVVALSGFGLPYVGRIIRPKQFGPTKADRRDN